MSNAEKTVMFALPNIVSGQLACVAGTAAGRSWQLSAGTFVIGRTDDNDMALPQEPGVSKVHAKIIGQADRYIIADCESRNGTLLNGQLIQRAELYDGDEIRICGCTLRFTQKGGSLRPRPATVQPALPEPTVDIPGPATEQMPSAAVREPAFAAPPPPERSWSPEPEVQQPMPTPPSTGRILATWYAAGLVGSLLLGGAASAALVVTTPSSEPVPPGVGAVVDAGATGGNANSTADAGVVAAVDALNGAADAGAGAALADAGAAAAAADAGIVAVGDADTVVDPKDDGRDETVDDGAEKPGRVRRPRRSTPPKPAEPEEAAPAEVLVGEPQVYSASVDGGKSETIKARTAGRVRSVDVKDGDVVSRGQVLVTFDSGADPAEVATLEDRIASLENAEDEEAKRELKASKQKLAAIEGGAKSQPITASTDGKLSGFNVVVGAILRAGEAVGKVGEGDVPARVRITVGKGTRLTRGQPVTLMLKAGGTAEGSVLSISGRTVIIDTGSEAGDAVENVRF